MSEPFRLNRFFSLPFTAVLLRTPLTPNQVTLLSVLCGLAAGVCFSFGDYGHSLAGGTLYVLACILDDCDGDIARAKKRTSVLGGWLDIAGDYVTDVSLFSGLAWSLLKAGPELRVLGFYGVCVAGATLHIGLVILEKLRGFGPAVYGKSSPVARKSVFSKILDALREGDAAWLVLAFAVAGQAHTLIWFGAAYTLGLSLAALWLHRRHYR